MKSVLSHIKELLPAAGASVVVSYLVNYAVVLYWRRDGFDVLEISLMSVALGFFLLLGTGTVGSLVLRSYRRAQVERNEKPLGRFKQFLVLFPALLVLSGTLDLFLFSLGGDAIAADFTDGLRRFMISQNVRFEDESLEVFSRLPFFFQNIVPNAIALAIGATAAVFLGGLNIKEQERTQRAVA